MSASARRPSVVTPGNHDGVHRGHQALVAAARALATPRGARVVGLTFDPHPVVVLAPERASDPLTTPARRAELLRLAGCDDVVVARFDEDYAKLSATEWVERALVRELDACGVVVGEDFRFGAGRQGDLEMLGALGATHGFVVERVAPVLDDGRPVSSSRVRQALKDGDVATAARLQGHVHEVSGEVVRGDQRGRTIGFPTANVRPDAVLLPADGVYAVVLRRLDDARAPLARGVANLGTRPTFAAGRSLEAHLFDFDADLYGAAVRVGFVARLREERRFDGRDALVSQIRKDADDARAVHARDDGRLLAWI